jgi:hypothetical protein
MSAGDLCHSIPRSREDTIDTEAFSKSQAERKEL